MTSDGKNNVRSMPSGFFFSSGRRHTSWTGDWSSDVCCSDLNVGAGAGATIGKLAGPGRAMKAGLGSAALTLSNGLIVAALVAVNAIGDVIDPATGRVIAGVRTPDGSRLADARALVRAGALLRPTRPGQNTTIGVVATNAALTKAQATK